MKKKYSHEFSHIDGRIEKQLIKVADTFTKHKRLKAVSRIKFDSIDTLISSIEKCYPETGGHSIRVGYYAGYIAEILGFDEDYIRAVELAGTLHDVGKLGIPSHILNKKCSLTNEEYKLIQKHPLHTSKILRSIEGFHHISKITLHHHERGSWQAVQA